jgi:hypothetical protein
MAVTGDGRWRIGLYPPASPHDTTTLTSPAGNLATLNWVLEMEPA